MPVNGILKSKQPCHSRWKSKIIRQFAAGWIETDNACVSSNSNEDNHVRDDDKTVEASDNSDAFAKKPKTAFSYPNFVKPESATVDPGIEKRDIQRLKHVILYMYNDNKISLKLSFEEAGLLLEGAYDEQAKLFRYLVNDREICRAEGDQQEAHTKARDRFCEILKYYCYTVKRLKEYHTRRNVFRKIPGAEDKGTHDDKRLNEGNIGFRMLQRQGWTGGSLGSNEEGILEPIGVQKKVGKAGLGARNQNVEKIPVEAFMAAIKQYASGNALYDLVFSTQFSKHQIIKLKDYAMTLKLFPQMIGKKKQLVISKKLTLLQIKEGVLKGHSDLCAKYAVIPPIAESHK